MQLILHHPAGFPIGFGHPGKAADRDFSFRRQKVNRQKPG
jgi:hypothetical protein